MLRPLSYKPLITLITLIKKMEPECLVFNELKRNLRLLFSDISYKL